MSKYFEHKSVNFSYLWVKKMLCVLKRMVSLRRFFCIPTTLFLFEK